jgi:predicted DNA-binding protein with PD1-like motif
MLTMIPMREPVEVLSLMGDIALDKGTHGGHLLNAHFRHTLEVILVEPLAGIKKTYAPFSRLDWIGV